MFSQAKFRTPNVKITLFVFLLSLLATSIFAQDAETDKTVRVRYISSAPRGNSTVAANNRAPGKIRIIQKGEEDKYAKNKIEPTDFSLEKRAFSLVNDIRIKQGLKELVWSDKAAEVARVHSENMAKYNFFSHVGLDGALIDARASNGGLDNWRSIGENIAYCMGFDSPADFVVERWMLSPGHKENILNKNWQQSGIGMAKTEDGMYFFTQIFFAE
ncbi:MAG: CAP domain-containing protein [Pyrinomonadaceae bacterium]